MIRYSKRVTKFSAIFRKSREYLFRYVYWTSIVNLGKQIRIEDIQVFKKLFVENGSFLKMTRNTWLFYIEKIIVKYWKGIEAFYMYIYIYSFDYGRVRYAAAPTTSARFRTSNPFRFDSLLDGRRTSPPWFVTHRVKNCSAGNCRAIATSHA